ncbi:hypothetical protein AQUCO_08400025v1 [Aquilegia coerulea]|uniref:Bet v I/Major latex protein domain-containing protein n=1 Tax=Aquilegia coerulea TaxID=218851 RepID=A0A2G5C6Q4_AQUCA|nr:hypothetical protein AQUCO_08400025v1 [Aquilegia coerulea]
MEGHLSHELEVNVPANEVWEVYRGLELGRLVTELLPNLIEKVELVEGDGGVGTILNVVFPIPPETPAIFTSWKEKFTKIDDEKRLKEAEVIEGAFLQLGFSLYRVTFVINEKDANSCIIKSMVDYKLDTESAANASLVSTQALELIAQAIGKYLTDKKN